VPPREHECDTRLRHRRSQEGQRRASHSERWHQQRAGLTAAWVWPALAPLAGLFVRPAVAVSVFAAVLAVTGFFRRSERAYLAELQGRLSGRLQ